MGTCELESGDVALAAIPIRKMTIGIAQTLLLIIEWRIAMPKRTTGDRPELRPINVGAIDIGSRMHMAALNPACIDEPVRWRAWHRSEGMAECQALHFLAVPCTRQQNLWRQGVVLAHTKILQSCSRTVAVGGNNRRAERYGTRRILSPTVLTCG